MLPVYVISLTDATERREHVSTQLFHENMAYDIFDAISIDARNSHSLATCDLNTFELNTGRSPSAGEIGCFLSHRSLWAHCVNLDKPIVVLEDDFALLSTMRPTLQFAAEHIEQLGFLRLQNDRSGKKIPVFTHGEFTISRYTKAPHGTMAYVLNPTAAKILLSSSTVICAPVDVFMKMFWLHGQPIHAITPYLIGDSHLSRESCIGAREKKQRPIPRKLLRSGYKLSHWLQRIYANQFSFRQNTSGALKSISSPSKPNTSS